MLYWKRKITSATKPTAPGCIPDYEPFPFRQRKKRHKVGPFSKRLSFAMLDLRTKEGRYARDICDGIAADLGGAPNAAQQLLCQMFALKVLRVQLVREGDRRLAQMPAVAAHRPGRPAPTRRLRRNG